MAAKPKQIFLSALAGPPILIGKVYDGLSLFNAIEDSSRAATAGYDGRIYVLFNDDTIREFRRATKDFGATIAAPWDIT